MESQSFIIIIYKKSCKKIFSVLKTLKSALMKDHLILTLTEISFLTAKLFRN